MELLIHSFIIIFIIQIVFFAGAAFFKTDKVTDLSYGLTFVVLAWVLLFRNGSFDLFHLLITFMVTIWGVRLSGFLFMRIMKTKKDKRFDGIRENFFKFARFWILQAVAIFIIMLPSVLGFSKDEISPGIFSYVGFGLWMIGIVIEAAADWQKYTFKNDPQNAGKWTDIGLWKYARHPNYFGEMISWWGLFIFIMPHLLRIEYLSIVGPIFITCLLLFGTGIPPLERLYKEKYIGNAEYQKYRNSTHLLIPIPGKSGTL